jgi:hypothetical protein
MFVAGITRYSVLSAVSCNRGMSWNVLPAVTAVLSSSEILRIFNTQNKTHVTRIFAQLRIRMLKITNLTTFFTSLLTNVIW